MATLLLLATLNIGVSVELSTSMVFQIRKIFSDFDRVILKTIDEFNSTETQTWKTEISLPRGERGGKIFVTAGVGSSEEGGVNRKDPNFIFGVMGIKFWRLFTSPKINYWICKILSRLVSIHNFASALGRGLSFYLLLVGGLDSITLSFGIIQNKINAIFLDWCAQVTLLKSDWLILI